VRQLKKDGAEPDVIKAEVDKLKELKVELEKVRAALVWVMTYNVIYHLIYDLIYDFIYV
jgi:hypothetical protein